MKTPNSPSPDAGSRSDVAHAIVRQGPDSSDSFFAKVRQRLDEANIRLPCVVITYDAVRVVVKAIASRDALPTLWNATLAGLKYMAGRRPASQDLVILHSISGEIQPGRFTLLLGPPSSGKTTFLRVLAGRKPSAEFGGSVRWNGHAASEFCAARTIAFVPQVDAHIGILTARETAAFSFAMQNSERDSQFKPSAAVSAASGAPRQGAAGGHGPGGGDSLADLAAAVARHELTEAQLDALVALMLDGDGRVELVMEMFGLANCAQTRVGNAIMRGISGGERKRLSTVEMMMGRMVVSIMDEISTGLDSATLFNVIRWLRAMSHHLRTTNVVSLLQPPPETFALFDDVIIMAEGRAVYHGPVRGAVPFFATLGFVLPPRKDVPSFLQELMTVRGQARPPRS